MPVITIAPSSTTEAPEPPESVETETSAPDKKTIVMDGPLSTLYTKALQIVYPQTSASQESQIFQQIAVDEAEESEEQPDLYVYATDSSMVEEDPEVFRHLSVALDKYGPGKTVVAIETARTIGSHQAVLESYLVGRGVTIWHQRDRAVHQVISRLR